MSRFGIFRTDPPPVQGLRNIPIPAQGQQPPRLLTSIVNYMTAVGSWPTGMEPGLPQPYLRRGHIVPLTLAYGQIPPSSGSMSDPDVLYTMMVSWLPPDPLPQPNLRYGRIVPLTFVYGDQPPNTTGLKDLDLLYLIIVQSWQPPDPLPQPNLKYGYIAPLTLIYGQQPPPLTGLRDLDLLYPLIVQSWQPIQQQPPALAETAAWNVPVVVTSTYQPALGYPFAIIQSWQPTDPTLQRISSIVPLTLTYGQQPPSYSIVNKSIIVQSWANPMPANHQPQRDNKNIVPITLVYGDTPPKYSIVNLTQLVYASQPWIPQPQRDNKNFAPLTLTYGDQPPRYTTIELVSLIASWNPPDPQPQQDKKDIVSLTLIYGDNPPKYSTVNTIDLVQSWNPPAPQPPRDLKNIVPLILTYGQQPPSYTVVNDNILIESWTLTDTYNYQIKNEIADNIIVVQSLLFNKYPINIVNRWSDTYGNYKYQAKLIPFVIIVGDQPPPYSTVNLDILIKSWEPLSNYSYFPLGSGGAIYDNIFIHVSGPQSVSLVGVFSVSGLEEQQSISIDTVQSVQYDQDWDFIP